MHPRKRRQHRKQHLAETRISTIVNAALTETCGSLFNLLSRRHWCTRSTTMDILRWRRRESYFFFETMFKKKKKKRQRQAQGQIRNHINNAKAALTIDEILWKGTACHNATWVCILQETIYIWRETIVWTQERPLHLVNTFNVNLSKHLQWHPMNIISANIWLLYPAAKVPFIYMRERPSLFKRYK